MPSLHVRVHDTSRYQPHAPGTVTMSNKRPRLSLEDKPGDTPRLTRACMSSPDQRPPSTFVGPAMAYIKIQYS